MTKDLAIFYGCISLLTVVWVKVMIDQRRLLKVYRKIVNPPFPMSNSEITSSLLGVNGKSVKEDITEVLSGFESIAVPFMKFPRGSELYGLARLVKLDLLLTLGVFFGVIMIFAALVAPAFI